MAEMSDGAQTLSAPEYPAEREAPPPGRWMLRVTGALLVLALVVQLFYFSRAALLPGQALCATLHIGCSPDIRAAPARTDFSAVQLIDPRVQARPGIDGVLSVQATLLNQTARVQTYPLLDLRFFDLTGRARVGRVFSPGEYLQAGTPVAQRMPPGIPVPAYLEILDPGLPVLSFQMELR